jgi:hypothetical protein
MTLSIFKTFAVAGAAAVFLAGAAAAEEGAGTPGIDMMTKARQIYIFRLDPDTSAAEVRQLSNDAVRVGGGQPRFTFDTYFKGFSIQVSDAGLARIQEKLPELGAFHRAGIYGIAQGKPDNPGGGGGGGGKPGNGGGEEDGGELIPWGVERMVGLKPDDSVNIQDCENGATCRTIWVLDTGVDQDHPDLNIDTTRSAEFIDAFGPRGKNTKDDENGHGTHVAGTAAAKNNNIQVVGVAAGATVVSVRVLDRLGFGYNDEVLKGLDHVAADGACGRGEVINMSLSDDASATGALDIDLMVESMAKDGCLFALAAGNETRNVTNVSPARVEHANVFTVSAIDSNDNFASFSNYGAGVDRAAPGVNVVSLKRGNGTESKDGTSMAAPHVAGLLALGGAACVGSDGTVMSGDPDVSPDDIAHLAASC